ncbi:MAG: hypothetical protein K2M75_05015 [Clostridia bacterium]|nr:hypothetical protein [Clostridia bacterium]
METIQNMQLKERITGTLLRLSWLAAIVLFVPMLSYVMFAAMGIAKILYMVVLVIIIMATAFLILLDEGFRNALNAESADVMPIVRNVYQSYTTIIYILLAVCVVLGVLTIILAMKEHNGKSSRKRIISSSVMIVLALIGCIVYATTRSKVLGA